MLRYIISIIVLSFALAVNAQLFESIEPGRQAALRVNVDPSLFTRSYFLQADMSGFDVSVDAQIKQNLFIEAGVGWAGVSQVNDVYDYQSNGMYATLGANLNLTQYQSPTDRHIFYVGLQYGYAILTHEVAGIYYDNYYWGETYSSLPTENRTASWVGIALGIKAEAAKNLFIGWSAESKLRTHFSSGDISPYYIAGLGKAANPASLDFNIWLSYAFSFKPKKVGMPLVDSDK